MYRVFVLAAVATVLIAGASASTKQDPHLAVENKLSGQPFYYVEGGNVHGPVSAEPLDKAVYGRFSDEIETNGWSFLSVTTKANVDQSTPRERSYNAGYLEGQLTAKKIHEFYVNTYYDNGKKQDELVTKNLAFMKKEIAANPNDAWWQQIDYIMAQVEGLTAGYNAAVANSTIKGAKPMTFLEQYMTSIVSEFDDLTCVTDPPSCATPMGMGTQGVSGPGRFGKRGKHWSGDKCSAVVSVSDNNKDIIFGHVSWDGYEEMTRIFKLYEFDFTPAVAKQVFSSYPSTVLSTDDFYMLSSGLVALSSETGPFPNKALYADFDPEKIVWQAIRNLVANRLATTAPEWAANFARLNSGTCNNLWLITDTKLFTPNAPLKPNTFWVVDQTPGLVGMADQTATLEKQRHFGSFNLPYYHATIERSGFLGFVKNYGGWWNYSTTPRELILQRDHHKIQDLYSMASFMRYNDFKHDPLAACKCTPPYSGTNGISARDDLSPWGKGTHYPFADIAPSCFGGYDAKIATAEMARNLQAIAISGPTNEQQPTFQWSTSYQCNGTDHIGQPDKWDMPWVNVTWA